MKPATTPMTAREEALAHAAIDRLERMMQSRNPAVALAAVQEILDRSGLHAERVVQLIGGRAFAASRPSRSKRGRH